MLQVIFQDKLAAICTPPPLFKWEAVAFLVTVYRGDQMPQFLVTFCCPFYIPDLYRLH